MTQAQIVRDSTAQKKNVSRERAKTAVRHQQTAGTSENISRRRFLKYTIGSLGLLAALEAGGTTLAFLQPRQAAAESGGQVLAGWVDEFQHGSVTEFRDGRFFLIRAEDGGFMALYRRCPHLGCTINWLPQQGRFYCPCHASSFDPYGTIDDARVPRPLDTFSVVINEGQVIVDTRRALQREQFSTDQLTYG